MALIIVGSLQLNPADHTRERNGGVLAKVSHELDLVRDLFVPKSCSYVSRFGEPNDGVRSPIFESDANAEVERALKITDKLSGFTFFLATSNKSNNFIP